MKYWNDIVKILYSALFCSSKWKKVPGSRKHIKIPADMAAAAKIFQSFRLRSKLHDIQGIFFPKNTSSHNSILYMQTSINKMRRARVSGPVSVVYYSSVSALSTSPSMAMDRTSSSSSSASGSPPSAVGSSSPFKSSASTATSRKRPSSWTSSSISSSLR